MTQSSNMLYMVRMADVAPGHYAYVHSVWRSLSTQPYLSTNSSHRDQNIILGVLLSAEAQPLWFLRRNTHANEEEGHGSLA